jgi:hypothetical protein
MTAVIPALSRKFRHLTLTGKIFSPSFTVPVSLSTHPTRKFFGSISSRAFGRCFRYYSAIPRGAVLSRASKVASGHGFLALVFLYAKKSERPFRAKFPRRGNFASLLTTAPRGINCGKRKHRPEAVAFMLHPKNFKAPAHLSCCKAPQAFPR